MIEGPTMHVHVNARRWFQPTYGNTYHTVTVTVTATGPGGERFAPYTLGPSDLTYGYGEHFLHTAGVLLVEAELMPSDFDPYDLHGNILQREHPTVTLTYDVADVPRKGDLHNG